MPTRRLDHSRALNMKHSAPSPRQQLPRALAHPPGRRGCRRAMAYSLALLAAALCSLVYSSPPSSLWGQLQQPPSGEAGSLTGPLVYRWSLRRAAAAVALEQRTDAEPGLGPCLLQRSQLPQLPHSVCARLSCLQSAALGQGVDLDGQPFAPLASGCPAPLGGQGPAPVGQRLQVSYILPFHNGAAAAAQCLLELFRTAGEADSAEYLVVDGGSTEDTTPLAQALWRLEQLFGVRVKLTRLERAVGLAEAAAEGARLANGQYLAIVQSSTLVARGWLAAILDTFQTYPKAGLVVPRLLGDTDSAAADTPGPSLLLSNGSLVSYAEFEGQGDKPQANMSCLRRVDVVPSACMVLPRELFKQHGLGLYEGAALGMSIRQAGYDVLVQPLALAAHSPQALSSPPTASLVKCVESGDRRRFVNEWRGALQERHCPPGTDLSLAASRRGYPRLLYVGSTLPEPGSEAGASILTRLSLLVAAGYHVTFAAANRDPALPEGAQLTRAAQLRHLGVHVLPPAPPERWVLAVPGPRGGCLHDAILVAHAPAFELAQGQIGQQCRGAALVFDTAGLGYLAEARDGLAALAEKKIVPSWDFGGINATRACEWLERPQSERERHTRDVELYFIDKANLTVVSSSEEVQAVKRYRPDARVEWVGDYNGHVIQRTQCEGRQGALFVGSMDTARDRRVVLSLLQQVLPEVLRALPAELGRSFKLEIAGVEAEVHDELVALFRANRKHVRFHSGLSQEELVQLYSHARVTLAPLLSGAGVHSRVVQAFRLGVPVVATPLAVEGLGAHDGADCWIGASAEEFARKVAQALTINCRVWERISAGAQRNLKENFSTGTTDRVSFLQALTKMGLGPLPEVQRRSCPAMLQAANVTKSAAGA